MKKRLLSITAVAVAIIMILGVCPLSVSAITPYYTINVTVVGNGEVDVDPGTTGLEEGTLISLGDEEADDSKFVRFEARDSSGAEIALTRYIFWYQFNMPASDVYVTAYFEKRGEITYTWLNDDGSVLDTKTGYVGREAPTTSKTPVKSNDPDGIYVFDGWTVQSSTDTQITYTPKFRDTTQGPAFVDVNLIDSDNTYTGGRIVFTGYLKDVGKGTNIANVDFTAELIYNGEVIDSQKSRTGAYNMAGVVMGELKLPADSVPGTYTFRLYYKGNKDEAEYTTDVIVKEPTHLNIEATSPHQAALNENIVFEGTVTFDDGTPASGIDIAICGNTSFSSIWSRTTDANGKFTFDISGNTEGVLPLYFKPKNSEYTSEIASSFTYVYSGSHTITIQESENGSASAVTSAKCGDIVDLTVTPDEGYKLKEWEVVSGGVTVKDNSFIMETNDVVLKPVFEVYNPTIEIDLGDLGEPIVIQTTYGKKFFTALLDANIWGTLDDMETEDYLFRDIATKPLSEFSDMDEYNDDTDELINRPVKEDLHVYACFFTKIKNVALTIDYPYAGDVVTLDENYIQSNMPEFTVADNAHCSIIIDEYSRPEWWIPEGEYGSTFFEGTFEAGKTYGVSALLNADFGYWLDSETAVTVNGEPADETSGALAVYFSKPFTVKEAPVIGDVNGDKKVDVLDAVPVQKYAVDKTKLTPEQLIVADVNNDNNVDILDAAEIQKFAAGKISEFKRTA